MIERLPNRNVVVRPGWKGVQLFVLVAQVGQPPGLISKLIRRPLEPNKQQAFNDRRQGARGRDQNETGRFGMLDELCELGGHGLHVGGNQDAPSLRRQLQDVGIGSAVGDDADMALNIDARFAAAESPPDIRIKVGVGLEPDLQATFGALP